MISSTMSKESTPRSSINVVLGLSCSCRTPSFRAIKSATSCSLSSASNQTNTPHDGHGASPVGCDGSIRHSAPQTGQRFGQPSGVRDAIGIGQPSIPSEARGAVFSPKGWDKTAQGNALGFRHQKDCSLKGCDKFVPAFQAG